MKAPPHLRAIKGALAIRDSKHTNSNNMYDPLPSSCAALPNKKMKIKMGTKFKEAFSSKETGTEMTGGRLPSTKSLIC
jgi:hypothetical protein